MTDLPPLGRDIARQVFAAALVTAVVLLVVVLDVGVERQDLGPPQLVLFDEPRWEDCWALGY